MTLAHRRAPSRFYITTRTYLPVHLYVGSTVEIPASTYQYLGLQYPLAVSGSIRQWQVPGMYGVAYIGRHWQSSIASTMVVRLPTVWVLGVTTLNWKCIVNQSSFSLHTPVTYLQFVCSLSSSNIMSSPQPTNQDALSPRTMTMSKSNPLGVCKIH